MLSEWQQAADLIAALSDSHGEAVALAGTLAESQFEQSSCADITATLPDSDSQCDCEPCECEQAEQAFACVSDSESLQSLSEQAVAEIGNMDSQRAGNDTCVETDVGDNELSLPFAQPCAVTISQPSAASQPPPPSADIRQKTIAGNVYRCDFVAQVVWCNDIFMFKDSATRTLRCSQCDSVMRPVPAPGCCQCPCHPLADDILVNHPQNCGWTGERDMMNIVECDTPDTQMSQLFPADDSQS